LSSRGSENTPIRFLDVDRGKQGETVFEFDVLGLLPSETEELYLRKKGDQGTESLIKRRLTSPAADADNAATELVKRGENGVARARRQALPS
jgi:hypothetical protein